MDSFPVSSFKGYKSQTFDFKKTSAGPIKLDVVYPEQLGHSINVLVHYHGGYLIFGDRYSFMSYWLVHACARRNWIFVTPDYRLIPESTAHSSLEDTLDAYRWALESLPAHFGCKVESITLAGSSAGGYLALSTAAAAERKPDGLLLVYGMLDATFSRYISPGENISGQPLFDCSSTLSAFPHAGKDSTRLPLSGHPVPANPTDDARFALAAALHIEALFPDYMTGVDGLAKAIAKDGEDAIAEADRALFPLSFGDLKALPKTFLVHGRNDSAVPVDLSIRTADKLKAAGVQVETAFPDDAEHGFDAQAGDVNVETLGDADLTPAMEALRRAALFLDTISST